MTPHDKLRSLPAAAPYLKPGIAFEVLDAQAREMSGQQAARKMRQARDRLFKTLTKMQKLA